MRVREATAADIPELARLRWDSRADEQAGHSREGFLHECGQWLRPRVGSATWVMAVVEVDAGLGGCMFLQCVEKVPVPGATERAWGYVTHAYVDSQLRGQGGGERLLQQLVAIARERNLEFLIVWPSAAAVEFYRCAGFREVSEAHAGPEDALPLEMVLT